MSKCKTAPLALLLLLLFANCSAGQRLADTEACRALHLVSRTEWDAATVGATEQPVFARVPKRVFVHHAWDGQTCADIDSCSVRVQAIQAYHMRTKNWPDIGYNFLVAGDGAVYEGRGFNAQGFHTLGYNADSLGVALIGTYHKDRAPSPAMMAGLEALLECARDSGHLTHAYALHGHRDARCTLCPGDAAYAQLAHSPLIGAHFRPGPLARYSCPSGGGVEAAAVSRANDTLPANELQQRDIASFAAEGERHKVETFVGIAKTTTTTTLARKPRAVPPSDGTAQMPSAAMQQQQQQQQVYLVTKIKQKPLGKPAFVLTPAVLQLGVTTARSSDSANSDNDRGSGGESGSDGSSGGGGGNGSGNGSNGSSGGDSEGSQNDSGNGQQGDRSRAD